MEKNEDIKEKYNNESIFHLIGGEKIHRVFWFLVATEKWSDCLYFFDYILLEFDHCKSCHSDPIA